VHTLVLYSHSERADAVLRETAERADELTVLVLAHREEPGKGCCDTRSVLWNEVCRDLAGADLTHAALALRGDERAELALIEWSGLHPADSVTAEALRRDADEIVLADPKRVGLGRRERRRLLRRSPLPVSGL